MSATAAKVRYNVMCPACMKKHENPSRSAPWIVTQAPTPSNKIPTVVRMRITTLSFLNRPIFFSGTKVSQKDCPGGSDRDLFRANISINIPTPKKHNAGIKCPTKLPDSPVFVMMNVVLAKRSGRETK